MNPPREGKKTARQLKFPLIKKSSIREPRAGGADKKIGERTLYREGAAGRTATIFDSKKMMPAVDAMTKKRRERERDIRDVNAGRGWGKVRKKRTGRTKYIMMIRKPKWTTSLSC